MGILESALIALVLVWTLIFIILGIALIILLHGVKKSLERINNILADAQDFTHNVSRASSPLKFITTALSHFLNKKK